jgi:N-acetylglucosaminyldiphosphoundecaprenol N-acetyl-beta-D-mannosaminyltransferase
MASIADNTPQLRGWAGAVHFDALTRWEVANHVRDELVRGRGGRVAVLSHELLRHIDDTPAVREMLGDADLVLAGSASTVWASRLAGAPLPQRFTAPALADALCAACNADGRRVYLIGGAYGAVGRAGLPGTAGKLRGLADARLLASAHPAGLPRGAARAAAVLGLRHQGLKVAGCAAPTAAVATDQRALGTVVEDLAAAKPDLILLGVDHLAAEQVLAQAARAELPGSWLFGSVGLIAELAGDPARRGGRGMRVSYLARLFAAAAAARVRR